MFKLYILTAAFELSLLRLNQMLVLSDCLLTTYLQYHNHIHSTSRESLYP